jgi:hypothetical protein
MGEPGSEMIVFGRDEHLALAAEAPPRARVLHPVEVAFEAQTEWIGLFGEFPLPCSDGPGGTRRQSRVEQRLALGPADHGAAHEGVRALVGVPDRSVEAVEPVEVDGER